MRMSENYFPSHKKDFKLTSLSSFAQEVVDGKVRRHIEPQELAESRVEDSSMLYSLKTTGTPYPTDRRTFWCHFISPDEVTSRRMAHIFDLLPCEIKFNRKLVLSKTDLLARK